MMENSLDLASGLTMTPTIRIAKKSLKGAMNANTRWHAQRCAWQNA